LTFSPTTLTTEQQRLILRATGANVRDHTIISLALGTGLRLADIVGLDVGDVFTADGTPRVRMPIRSGRGREVTTACVLAVRPRLENRGGR
jgi:integrase